MCPYSVLAQGQTTGPSPLYETFYAYRAMKVYAYHAMKTKKNCEQNRFVEWINFAYSLFETEPAVMLILLFASLSELCPTEVGYPGVYSKNILLTCKS